MGRLRDSLHTLLTGSSTEVEIARMRAQWASLIMEVANVMDQLATKVGRMTKEGSRAAARKLEGEAPKASVATPTNGETRWERKAELRRRRISGVLAGPPPPSEPETKGKP